MNKRRSFLFVPSIRKDFLEKIKNYNCDAVILDLEDSVMPSHKAEARKNLSELNFNNLGNKEIVVRINSVDSPFIKEDLEFVSDKKPHAIMVPKVEDVEQIRFLEKNTKDLEFIPIIETLRGYFNAENVLSSSDRIKAFAFGAEDFRTEAGIEKGVLKENPVLMGVMSRLLLISKMNSLWFIDCVYTGFGNDEHLKKLKEEAEFTKSIGADGKLLIHPSQIEIVNEVYSLSKGDIKKSVDFLSDFEKIKHGSSVIAYNNVMEDTPSYKLHKKFIEKAKRLGYI